MPETSGALSPSEAAESVRQEAINNLQQPTLNIFIQNVYGALLLSSGGLLSIILGAGFPEFTEQNPGLQRLLQGSAFPLGLVLVYMVGAELFTALPMWYAVATLSRRGRPIDYIRGAFASWSGNLLGALFATLVFTAGTQALKEDPWHSGTSKQITEDIVEMPWYFIFVRAIGCGWLVTVAMFLGTQNQDGISKVVSLHFPFLISTTARFPHVVEYMFLASTGMVLGAPLNVGGYFWKCLLPITLGNTVGGGFFTGAYLWWTYLRGSDQKYQVPGAGESRHDMGRYLLDGD